MRIQNFLLAALLPVMPAAAADINVIGLFPGKAVVVVNRGAPRTLSVGQRTPEGVLLVAVEDGHAVVEFEGKRERLAMGQHFETGGGGEGGGRQSTTLFADERGHYVVNGQVNGSFVRFLVDTGATAVALPASEARRLGIDYRRGDPSYLVVADGRRVASYRVKLDSVTVGDLTLFNVEGVVHESSGPGMALLGMTFLNRTEMRREGASLVLIKRY